MILFYHECDGCECPAEERVFTDTWTGKSLCCSCLYKIIGKVTMSPEDEGDNLLELMETLV